MTSDEAAAPDSGTADKTGPLPFDTTKAHHARAYDYMLGGKQRAGHRRPVAATTAGPRQDDHEVRLGGRRGVRNS
jgi:hypothetical protein